MLAEPRVPANWEAFQFRKGRGYPFQRMLRMAFSEFLTRKSRTSSSGKKRLLCIPRGGSDGKRASPWQDIAEMYAQTACFWQDRRLMYVLSSEKQCWGIHLANLLPGRGPFSVRAPSGNTFERYLARKTAPYFLCPGNRALFAMTWGAYLFGPPAF